MPYSSYARAQAARRRRRAGAGEGHLVVDVVLETDGRSRKNGGKELAEARTFENKLRT